MGEATSYRLAALVTVLAASGCGGETAIPPEVPRLILVGVDGGSWNVIDPLLEAGELPNLAAILERGSAAELEVVRPPVSPVVWTSLATGRVPHAHGVDFFYSTRHSVKVPTVWERFAASGLRVGLYDYLVTWPPRSLPDGFMVPGWLRRDDRVSPPDLFQRLKLPPYAYSLDERGDSQTMVVNAEREIADKARYWNRMMEEFRLDAGAVIFYSMDAVSHLFWQVAFPGDFDPPVVADPQFAGVIDETMRGVDRAIGEIVAALAPEDNLVIVSDHGFQARPEGLFRWWALDVSELLAAAAVDPARDGVTTLFDRHFLALRIDAGLAGEQQETLERIRELFTTLRSTAGDPLFDADVAHLPERPSERRPDRPSWQRQVLAREPPGHAFFFATPIAANLDRLAPGDLIELAGDRLPWERVLTAHHQGGDHTMTGIFLAAGSLVRHRPRRDRLSALDVAPLLTYLAGRAIPDDLEGRLPERLIDREYLRRYPPRQVAAADAPRLAAEAASDPAEVEDDELDARLRALGYI